MQPRLLLAKRAASKAVSDYAETQPLEPIVSEAVAKSMEFVEIEDETQHETGPAEYGCTALKRSLLIDFEQGDLARS